MLAWTMLTTHFTLSSCGSSSCISSSSNVSSSGNINISHSGSSSRSSDSIIFNFSILAEDGEVLIQLIYWD